jgi:hypothetical protein
MKAGRVCFEVEDTRNDPYLVLSYSESPLFAGRECDSTGDQQERDLPLRYAITGKGLNCVGGGYNRGAFKYLTVYMPDGDVPTEGGLWHDGHVPPQRQLVMAWYHTLVQKLLAWVKNAGSQKRHEPKVTISALWVNCTAFPSSPNGRAYTGYFDSSSSLLNRVWYAGAWTLQLSTIDPKEGGSIIQFNRLFDGNTAPVGAWYSNYTIANGTTVTTDGAKRDRMVWPGDMTIAVPGIAVSTYDMLAVRNALDIIYHNQYPDGSMPYAGPPMGHFREFSDTYHLHTLVGTYFYTLYSGDLEWLDGNWKAYKKALEISIAKVDETGLLHVSSVADWIRPGMTGHNIEASSLLYEVLGNTLKLTTWLKKKDKHDIAHWVNTRERLFKGINRILYCPQDGMYADNLGRRGCYGPEKCLPQDGNSWALISGVFPSDAIAYNVSENLRKRWIKYGAPAVEFPNVISPFASSFELIAHTAAGNHDAAIELIELMWGYMMDGPGMTNSTLLEGYRTDGYVQYPAYWSAARNSHAHGWAAGPTTVLMQGVLGIKLTSPLGKTWMIEPQMTRWLSYARGGFATKLGKFEVDISLMRARDTGKRIERLAFSVPRGTEGILKWGGDELELSQDMGTRFAYYRYIDTMMAGNGVLHTWSHEDSESFVLDDTFVKPLPEQRPDGVVDWEKLEDGYKLGEQQLTAFRNMGVDSIKPDEEGANEGPLDTSKITPKTSVGKNKFIIEEEQAHRQGAGKEEFANLDETLEKLKTLNKAHPTTTKIDQQWMERQDARVGTHADDETADFILATKAPMRDQASKNYKIELERLEILNTERLKRLEEKQDTQYGHIKLTGDGDL